MDDMHLKFILAAAVIALAGWYYIQGNGSILTAATTTTTKEATTTIEEDTITPETTMPQDPKVLPECLLMNTACKRDRCYFGNALNRHKQTLCDEIKDAILKASCYEKVAENQTPTRPIIEGQVFNTVKCEAYQNLTVELRDETANNTIATTQTGWNGGYSFEAAAGADYGIYVTIGGTRINQNITSTANRRYVIDFALS